MWSLLKRDNLGSERAASHQPFLREQLGLFAAVTDRTNASFTNLPSRRENEHSYNGVQPSLKPSDLKCRTDLCATVYSELFI